MSITAQIMLAASDLLNGQNKRIVCPQCQSDERSLVIWHDDNRIRYRCFRATCSLGSGGLASTRRQTVSADQFKPKYCEEPMNPLHPELDGWIKKTYGIPDAILQGFKYLPETHRLYMPVYNHLGATIGGVAKQLTKGKKPKTVLYRHQNATMVHFPKEYLDIVSLDEKSPIVVCEDILSAIKVNRLAIGCAILGTHISDDIAAALSRLRRPVVLMFDPDAVDKAVKYAKKYRAILTMVVIVPPKDPKDTPLPRLQELIYGM